MEFMLLLAGLLLSGLLYFLYKETHKPPADPRSTAAPGAKKTEPDPLRQAQKRVLALEEKLKKAEADTEALRRELAEANEREKNLLKERSATLFDAEQFEKFKNEFATLKQELARKEELLEAEISQRRAQAAELTSASQEKESLKKRLTETEDASRKAQAGLEKTSLELEAARKTLKNYQKIAQEHSEQKIEGDWVARGEFEKIERELREKEAMIQRLLTLKKGSADA